MNLNIFIFFVIYLEIISSEENVTKFDRRHIFLSRRKRYVQWPKGSNFVFGRYFDIWVSCQGGSDDAFQEVIKALSYPLQKRLCRNYVGINFTCTKPLLRYQPLTWNTVYEMDIPFAVQPDIFTKKPEGLKTKRSVLERRLLLDSLNDFVTSMGLNGQACIQRLLCEAEDFTKLKLNSMLKDLVKLLFRSSQESLNDYNDKCNEEAFRMCPISLLSIFINSSASNEPDNSIPDNEFINKNIFAM